MAGRRRRKGSSSAILMASLLPFIIGSVDLGSITTATGVITATLAIPHVNPPPKDKADKTTPVAPTALFFQMNWPPGFPHDIDKWLTCYNRMADQPRNRLVISYRQRSSLWMDLQRDDLGAPSVINLEEAKSNSEVIAVPPNTLCQVNAHLYHSHGGILPVEGGLLAIVNKDGENEKLIASLSFRLIVPGEEITLLSVAWDSNSQVILDSVKKWPDIETIKLATVPNGGQP